MDKLFQLEDPDEDDINDEKREADKINSNNQKSILMEMRRQLFRRDPTYQEVD